MSEYDRMRLSDLDKSPARRANLAASQSEADGQQIGAGLNPRQQAVLRMQQTHGNAAVRRMLVQRRVDAPAGVEGGAIDEEVTSQINGARGSGTTLDSGVAQRLGETMGHDFSDVHVHTDPQADSLNRSLSAKAFTTGSDIFFQQGAYQPSSSEGQHLLAHELTHVVQQSGSSPSGPLTLGPAEDSYEHEADSVASQAMSTSQPTAQREEECDGCGSSAQREAAPEDEEELQRMAIQREEAPEDEEEEM